MNAYKCFIEFFKVGFWMSSSWRCFAIPVSSDSNSAWTLATYLCWVAAKYTSCCRSIWGVRAVRSVLTSLMAEDKLLGWPDRAWTFPCNSEFGQSPSTSLSEKCLQGASAVRNFHWEAWFLVYAEVKALLTKRWEDGLDDEQPQYSSIAWSLQRWEEDRWLKRLDRSG